MFNRNITRLQVVYSFFVTCYIGLLTILANDSVKEFFPTNNSNSLTNYSNLVSSLVYLGLGWTLVSVVYGLWLTKEKRLVSGLRNSLKLISGFSLVISIAVLIVIGFYSSFSEGFFVTKNIFILSAVSALIYSLLVFYSSKEILKRRNSSLHSHCQNISKSSTLDSKFKSSHKPKIDSSYVESDIPQNFTRVSSPNINKFNNDTIGRQDRLKVDKIQQSSQFTEKSPNLKEPDGTKGLDYILP